MDHVVDDHAQLKAFSNVQAINSKSCKNTSLNKASPRKLKSRTSSNESEYEVVAEFDEEEAENGASCSEYEEDSVKNNKNDVKESVKTENNPVQNPSESAEMEEVFVVVEDDANEVDSNVEARKEQDEKKQILSDGDDVEMKEIPTKCEEQGEKIIPHLSDNEDDMDSLLDEFAETQSDEIKKEKKSDANIIVLSEGEEEMDFLLKEFSEENCFDEDSSTKQNLSQGSDSSLKNSSIKNEERTISSDIKKENSCDVSSNLQPVENCAIQSNSVQQSSNNQIHKSSANETQVKVSSDCVIVSDNDEKSNCSSIEILDDDSENETYQNTSLNIKGTSNKEVGEAKNKYSFKDMIVDIADDDTGDVVSHSDETKKVVNSSNALKMQVNSVVESSDKLNLANSTSENESLSNSKDESKDKTDFECSSVENISMNQNSAETSSEIKLPVKEIHSNEIFKTNESQKNSNTIELSCEDEDSSPIVIEDDDSSSKLSFKEPTLVSEDDREKNNKKKTLDGGLEETLKSEKEDDDSSKDVSEKGILSVADSDSIAEENVTLEIMKLVSEVAAKQVASDETNEDDILSESESVETRNNLKSDEKLISESKSLEKEDKLKSDSGEISVNTDIKIEEEHLDSGDTLSEDVKPEKKSLDSSVVSTEDKSCEEDCKKRKLEDVTVDSDAKKIRKEDDNQESNCINGDVSSASSASEDFGLKDTDIKELVSDVTVADIKAVDKVSNLMPWNPSEKIETTRVVLDKIAMYVCQEVVKDSYKAKYIEYKNEARALEEKIEKLSKNLDSFRLQFADFRDTQKVAFAEQNFKGKLHTRTVGVNVKIYRETEIKQVLSMPNSAVSKPAENSCIKQEKTSPKKEPASVTSNVKAVKSGLTQVILPSSQLKDTVITPVFTQQRNVRQQLIPRIIAHTNRPITGAQVVAGLQQRIPSPNVTVTGNRLIPFTTRAPSTQVVLLPSSSISTTSRKTLVEISKEDLARKALNSTSISSPSVAKVNVPGMPGNNPNVLLPLREYLQLLPPGAKGSSVIQSAPAPRQAIIPQLPSSLLGARTVTYFVPQNAGIGARGIPQFLSPSNQPVQFLLRVTNPGSNPTFSPVVTSVPRLTTTPQVTTNSAPRSSSGLVLFSHTSKHPAPFPKSPHYPDNKGKSIPPKPSLKGSKNSVGGIVLSWNMCMFRHHANIASYQLYAYQETDGPVDASLWKKVGDVNALPLPMACTLTQFVDKNRYYFTVRAVDVFQRFGPFSDPVSVFYDKDGGDSTTKK